VNNSEGFDISYVSGAVKLRESQESRWRDAVFVRFPIPSFSVL
jgi:hypothetical protein